MKDVSSGFKTNIKKLGRKLYDKITYTDGNETIILNEELYSVNPRYEASILKSVMKELEIESSVPIEKNTVVNYQLGLLINNSYEFINYGNYIVYSIEKIEDTDRYKILCYDKMLYSMKKYENMHLNYPMTLRDYINNVSTHLGLTFANNNSTFANWNKQIPTELYLDSQGNDIGYTFRDVLDEIAEATASTVCINNNDELEIRYITNTNTYIDEESLKDVNVNFGEKYGKVNSIVLSRSGEADNVYRKNQQSIDANGLTEIKIIDNQIMNDNNRADYLDDLASVLFDLEYYINDFSSTGILYYELCDRYDVHIGENSYSCVMLNDDVLRKDGLEEIVHTDMPEKTETDYTKADKDDRKINRTYLMVDKQNQVIQTVINTVETQNNKISQITQTVDELNSKISDIVDITTSGETMYGSVDVTGINESEPIMVKIHPNLVNIEKLYPRADLFPSSSLYPKSRILRFINTTDNTFVDYELPTDLLYLNQNVYDEFYLNYESTTCQVIKRCGYNADGTVYALQNETVINYPYPTIALTDGNYTISLLGYNYGYLFVRLVASNIYTSQFVTKAEMNSSITQKANEINATVALKLDEEDFTHASIVAKINDDTSQVLIEADKINITANDVINILAGNTLNLTSKTISITSTNFSVTPDGTVTMHNALITGTFANYDSGGNLAVKIYNQKIGIYDWESEGEWLGNFSGIHANTTEQKGLSICCNLGNSINLGYKESENDKTIKPMFAIDTSDINSVPYIKNTANGTMFQHHSKGIEIKNGLITNFGLETTSGNIFNNTSGGGIVVKDGLIQSWNFGTVVSGRIPIGNGYYIRVTQGLITAIEQ